MNIGEANKVQVLVAHLVEAHQVDDYSDEVVVAVVELNGRSRQALGAGMVLPSVWMMRREQIVSERKRSGAKRDRSS
jgi:hypothetical protein